MDDSLGKGLWRLLRQAVSDASSDKPVLVCPRKYVPKIFSQANRVLGVVPRCNDVGLLAEEFDPLTGREQAGKQLARFRIAALWATRCNSSRRKRRPGVRPRLRRLPRRSYSWRATAPVSSRVRFCRSMAAEPPYRFHRPRFARPSAPCRARGIGHADPGRALSMPKATVSYIGDAHERARSGVALAAPDAPNYSRSGTGTLKPLRVVDTRL
jgi:hypothetical protein